MSSPIVAGIAGMLRSINPLVSPGSPDDLLAKPGLRSVLRQSTFEAKQGKSWDAKLGFGRIDAATAARRMLGVAWGRPVRNRAIPLFGLVSDAGYDHAAVATPQLAVSLGTTREVDWGPRGTPISAYPEFPLSTPEPGFVPRVGLRAFDRVPHRPAATAAGAAVSARAIAALADGLSAELPFALARRPSARQRHRRSRKGRERRLSIARSARLRVCALRTGACVHAGRCRAPVSTLQHESRRLRKLPRIGAKLVRRARIHCRVSRQFESGARLRFPEHRCRWGFVDRWFRADARNAVGHCRFGWGWDIRRYRVSVGRRAGVGSVRRSRRGLLGFGGVLRWFRRVSATEFDRSGRTGGIPTAPYGRAITSSRSFAGLTCLDGPAPRPTRRPG